MEDMETQLRRVAKHTQKTHFGLELTHEPFERVTCTNCVKLWIGILCCILIVLGILFLLVLFNVI